MTYVKNMQHIKEAIFDKLNDDATLRTLLGGTGRIFAAYPEKVFNFSDYPVLTYQILLELDRPYNENDTEGLATEVNLLITILSSTDKTEESDNIESRVRTLLNGNSTLDTTSIICYSCFRTSRNQVFDSVDKKHITYSYFTLATAPKSS